MDPAANQAALIALFFFTEQDTSRRPVALKRDEVRLNRHRALALCLSMVFSENRYTLCANAAVPVRIML
jgi:hypothetical protein